MQRALRVSETSAQAAATEAEGRASESSSAGKRTGEGTAVNSESGPPLQHIAHLWHHGSLTEREPVTPMLSLWLWLVERWTLAMPLCANDSGWPLRTWSACGSDYMVQKNLEWNNMYVCICHGMLLWLTPSLPQHVQFPGLMMHEHTCTQYIFRSYNSYFQCCTFWGGGGSSVVRAPDSWLKGRGFESLLERRENFLLQGRLSVLTLISVSVPPPCYRSST